jgi:hypothetical protein
MSDTEGGQSHEGKRPTPNAPPASRAATEGNPPKAGKTLDLDRYRVKEPEPAVAAPTMGTKAERPRYPLVHWWDLAGIPNLRVVEVWLATSKAKPATATSPAKPPYEYVGANVRLPATGDAPSALVTVLTGLDTAAGQRMKAEYLKGTFDAVVTGRDPNGVLVHALNQVSTAAEKATKPYTVLTFG